MKWVSAYAAETLTEMLDDTHIMFLNQTKETTRAGLKFAERCALGGGDVLILANHVSPSVVEFETFDKQLIRLGRVGHGRHRLMIHSP